jgi:taurine dioxygenase
MTGIEVTRLAGACGAEIGGVDLSDNLDDNAIGEIRQALLVHQVIFFRNQTLTPEQHKAFGRRFGSLQVHPQYVNLKGHPEILPVLKEADATQNIGGVWHSDLSDLPAPPLGSILYAKEIPPYGGDTIFANQYLAYESLSEGMKALLGPLKAYHSSRTLSDAHTRDDRNAVRSTKLRADIGPDPEINLHPVVRTHPETGRKSIYVDAPHTVRFEGMSVAESMPLLSYLFKHCTRPEFTCRFRWQVCSVAFWDNRCLMHYALNDYHGQRRYLERVTVAGEPPR